MTNKDKILSHILDYLKLNIKDFKFSRKGKFTICTCPICKEYSARTQSHSYNLFCAKCSKNIGNIVDIIRQTNEEFKDSEESIILSHINDTLKLNIKLEEDVNNILDFYESNGFDLVPVARNQKNPIELAWTEKIHKDKQEWKIWLENGTNIGIKTGTCSNLTIVDIDQKTIPKEILDIIKGLDITTQITSKGVHLFFKYDSELPTTRIEDLKIDILNNGKQAVSYPSVVEGVARELIIHPLDVIPSKLKDFLKSKITIPNLKSFSEKLKEEIKTENIDFSDVKPIEEGGRNSFLLRFGGILRKELNINQTSYTLSLFNKYLCKPPLSTRELDNIVGSLDRYLIFDESELALKILQYMKVVEEANSRDIKEALGELGADGKQRIEKAIKYLTKEGFLYKKRRIYHLIKKAQWKNTFVEEGKEFDYNMPYFYDTAIFRRGDMIVIGASPKTGKTHLALNIIKQLVSQGKKPYYISLESGNRFASISLSLGLKEGDFNWCIHFTPEDIEIEKDAITIIDWLLPSDYAETDKLFQHFAQQLVKNGGLLIIFVQLKSNGDFFANNMISMFPAFVSRYMYDNEDDGTTGYFKIDYIREPKIRGKTCKIPCVYNRETKELKRIDEIKE